MLPYGRQLIEEDDIDAVVEALRSPFLTTGPAVAAFEDALADAVDAPYAVACSSGTAALHLACMAVELGTGDAAIVPSMTFLATANAVRFCGAEVVFADVCPQTGLMTPETLEAALKQAKHQGLHVKAAFPVHLNGQTADLPAIGAVAAKNGLTLIEDGCHALGTQYHNGTNAMRSVGDSRISQMTSFSFHPVKTIAMGEGGAVTTRDAALAERMRRLRNHGMVRTDDPASLSRPDYGTDGQGHVMPWYYEMPEVGYNYRASDIHCALGLSQLRKLARFKRIRRALKAQYDTLLAPLAPAIIPVPHLPYSEATYHLCAVHVDWQALGMERSAMMQQLIAAGIGTQVHYIPVHQQPYYRARYGSLSLPGADAYYHSILSLPLHVGMQEEDVARVVHQLTQMLKHADTAALASA